MAVYSRTFEESSRIGRSRAGRPIQEGSVMPPAIRTHFLRRSGPPGAAAAVATLLAAAIGLGAATPKGARPPAAAAPAKDTFEAHWQDGKAELDGYRYSITRYGEPRKGTAVMVYVTEPFSTTKFVKVNDPTKSPGDVFEALKLNFIRDFQTGIYDYNTMVSVFVRTHDLSSVKTTFSSAEWCGHVFEEMLYEPHHIADRYISYFEDESVLRRIRRFDDEVAEENLYVLLRGLRGEYLRPGARRRVHFLQGVFYRRLTHQPFIWSSALIERAPGTEAVSVPAGRFETSRYTVKVDGGRLGRFWIESAYPHRVVRWEWTSTAPKSGKGWDPDEAADTGELTGSARLAYWTLNHNGDESYLKLLGIAPGAAAMGAAPAKEASGKSSSRAR
jgi:hypothetical protein